MTICLIDFPSCVKDSGAAMFYDGPLGYLIGWIVGLFNLCLVLALLSGGYLGYTKPVTDEDFANHISAAAIHGAKENTEIVDNVGKWFGDQVAFHSLSESNPSAAQALLLIPKILIYYPAWAGAGVGGAIGDVLGDLANHAFKKGEKAAEETKENDQQNPQSAPVSQ